MSPTLEIILRTVLLCIALASVETLHGIARTVWANRLLGKKRALKLSIVSGTTLAFAVYYLLVPGIGLRSVPGLLALGILLSVFMAAFDLAIGRWVLRRRGARLLDDFDPRTGNLLVFGLLVLALLPLVVIRLQGLY